MKGKPNKALDITKRQCFLVVITKQNMDNVESRAQLGRPQEQM